MYLSDVMNIYRYEFINFIQKIEPYINSKGYASEGFFDYSEDKKFGVILRFYETTLEIVFYYDSPNRCFCFMIWDRESKKCYSHYVSEKYLNTQNEFDMAWNKILDLDIKLIFKAINKAL